MEGAVEASPASAVGAEHVDVYDHEDFRRDLLGVEEDKAAPKRPGRPNLVIAQWNDKPWLVYDLPEGRVTGLSCLECGGRLVAKRGDRRPHHFAHAPGSPDSCSCRGPEGRLHHLVKWMLANVFDVGGRPADVYGVCRRHPKRRVETAGMSLPMCWDDVQVERFTGTDRPDLVLLHGNAPVLAIEVTASNPLSGRKREAYSTAGVPWLEVDARAFEEILCERFECDLEQVEVADIDAVPVRQWTFPASSWRCPYCRAWSRFREGASSVEHEQDALLASDEDRFRPWWRRELDLTSGSGHDVTLDLCIGLVLDADLQPATVGLYLGEKLFPLLVTPYAAYLDERELLRDGMAAVLRRLLTVLRDHGAVVCGKTAWRVEDAAACGAFEQVTG